MKDDFQKYQNLFNTMELGVVYQDKNGKIIEGNQQILDIYGYTREEFMKLSFKDIVHPDDLETVLLNFKNNNTTPYEHRGIKKDGSIIFLETNASNIIIKDKLYRQSIIRDITNNKKVEIALRESEEKFRELAEQSPNMIFINYKGKIVYANKACEAFTEYKVKEFYDDEFDFMSLIDKRDFEKIKENFKKHQTGYDIQPYEYRIIGKKGKKLDVIINTKLINYQEGKAILGIVTDITERKLAEKKILESEKRFRAMIENNTDAIVLVSPDGSIIYESPAAVRLSGYSANDRLHQNAFELVYNEDKEKINKVFVQLLKQEGKSQSFKFRAKKKDGTIWWAEGVATNLLNTPGVNAIVVNYRDITDRITADKALKEQMKEYLTLNEEYLSQNDELRKSLNQIQKINTELTKAKRKAEESDRLKTSFLANMSHEIRTPMNGILGFAKLLKKQNLTGEQIYKYVDIIQLSGERMLNIINDLIDISKIEAGQVEIKNVETNINQLFDNLYTFFEPEAEKKELELTYDKTLPEEKSIITTDKSKLNQVMVNLIKNAIKYTIHGSISFKYTLINNYIQFEVKDTGIGIPKDHIDIIFDRFRQVDLTPIKSEEGSGLGLSISKAYIEMMEGEIWVNSELNKGSEFYFKIPYKPIFTYDKNQYVKETKTLHDIFNSLKILIVEDDEISNLYLKEILIDSGALIEYANNGKEAVEKVIQTPNYDIILMDIKLPILNGYEATKQIKKINPNIYVIAQTAFASENDRQTALKEGCDEYISKPINKDELFGKIKKVKKKK